MPTEPDLTADPVAHIVDGAIVLTPLGITVLEALVGGPSPAEQGDPNPQPGQLADDGSYIRAADWFAGQAPPDGLDLASVWWCSPDGGEWCWTPPELD